MEKIKVLIVEDEAIIGMEIQNRLEKLGYTITDRVITGEEAIQSVEEHPPDLILMDISLEGETDGIYTAKTILLHYQKPVIFITAHSDDATLEKAKKVGAYGYITKPIDEKTLKIGIEMGLEKYKSEIKDKDKEANKKGIKKVPIWNRDEIIFIDISEIIYLEIHDGIIHFITKKMTYKQRGTLNYWEERLSRHGFFRCHKSFLIQLNDIAKMIPDIDYTYSLKMKGSNHTIPVAKNKISLLKNRMTV